MDTGYWVHNLRRSWLQLQKMLLLLTFRWICSLEQPFRWCLVYDDDGEGDNDDSHCDGGDDGIGDNKKLASTMIIRWPTGNSPHLRKCAHMRLGWHRHNHSYMISSDRSSLRYRVPLVTRNPLFEFSEVNMSPRNEYLCIHVHSIWFGLIQIDSLAWLSNA